MTLLHLKLLRDLLHLKGQVIAIALVVTCGVATVITNRSAYDSLVISRAAYFTQYRLADVFASLKRAPESLAQRVREIPGVQGVRTRLVFEVTLDVPGLEEPATGHLVSIPERRVPMINDLYIRGGRYVEADRRNEILVSEPFAEANGLNVGDTVGAILNGRWERLRIVGIGLSPEFVYEIQGAQVLPDNRRFGILWMSRDAMGPAFDMEGAFNDVALTLAPGAIEEDVIAELDRLLERYGGLGAYGRDEHIPTRFLADEIKGNRVMGTVLPSVFLGVAAFLLNLVLSRLVSTQRDQIAILKAFGYSDATVAFHYLEYALVAVLLGSAVGTPLGLWLGAVVNSVYVQFYRFPVFKYEAGAGVVLLAIGVSAAAAVLGAYAAVRRALTLPPAEAMRPEPPASYHAGLLEKLGIGHLTSAPARMILRTLIRRPVRALLGVLGISFAVAILLVGRFFVDSMDRIAEVQFRLVQREDVTVAFHDPQPGRARHEIARLPGVLMTESFRTVPARLRFEHRHRRVGVLGLPEGTELRGLIDEDLRRVAVPGEGVLLTERLAEILGVSPGDRLTVEVLEGARPVRQVTVAGVVNELIGLSAYMNVEALNRLMREGRTVSGALLSVDPLGAAGLYSLLKSVPAVGGVGIHEAELASFEETIAQSMGVFTTVLVIFSCVIACAVIYNAARIALSERGRELASLRVIGFTRREVSIMLLGEQAILTLLAIPVGCLIGYWISALIARYYQWELFRLPLIISDDTYAFSMIVVVGASVLSGLVVRRRIDRLDLVAVLKTTE